MKNPPEQNNTRERNLRQEDLLSLIESLERQRRRLLIAVTRDFITWGELVDKTKAIIEEMKRRKFLQDSHEAEGS